MAARSYLFADPFTRPMGFANREYAVNDPTWDTRPASDLCAEHAWMRDRVAEIRDRVAEINETLRGRGRPPATLTSLPGSTRKATDSGGVPWLCGGQCDAAARLQACLHHELVGLSLMNRYLLTKSATLPSMSDGKAFCVDAQRSGSTSRRAETVCLSVALPAYQTRFKIATGVRTHWL